MPDPEESSIQAGSALALTGVSLLAACLCLHASNLSVDHEARVQYDLGGERVPVWSGGALVTFVANRTPAPKILSFDSGGRQLPPLILAIPESETVDLDDVTRGSDGTVAVCGAAYDHKGRGSGFLAVFSPGGEKVVVIRLSPYSPSRVAVASDGTIWTAGLELANAKDSSPPESGVIRRFDRAGKALGRFIPRSAFPSPLMVRYGMLRSGRNRIGWYTGPPSGPGSRYYDIFADGTVRRYRSVLLTSTERVNGLGLTDDGRTWLTTRDETRNTQRFLSAGGPGENWVEPPLPASLSRAFLYGAEGNRLVFYFTVVTVLR